MSLRRRSFRPIRGYDPSSTDSRRTARESTASIVASEFPGRVCRDALESTVGEARRENVASRERDARLRQQRRPEQE
ncbi:hypothetical protein DMJ13_09135 [halophilic archaeon]|nr:hypothetical protein DMJ13_09135 [halophilic archaeon]